MLFCHLDGVDIKENIDLLIVAGGDKNRKSPAYNINKLLQVLSQLTRNMFLITSCDKNNISNINYEHIIQIYQQYNLNFIKYFTCQISVFRELKRLYLKKDVKNVLFMFGHDLSILPIFFAKLNGSRIIIRSDGRPSVVVSKYLNERLPLKKIFFKAIEEIDYRIADVLLTECNYMISENNFEKFNAKIGNLPLDSSKYRKIWPICSRKYDVGFIGRLDPEKGISNFIKSLDLTKRKLNILIIGEGTEKDRSLSALQKLESIGKINFKFKNWADKDQLNHYFNEIKLLIIPSSLEGLPNIMLEAIASETPILASPVGGIPGIVKDGETGFIMENNSPECIAKNVIRALNHPNLDKIAENAHDLVRKEYTYEATVERYKKILSNAN